MTQLYVVECECEGCGAPLETGVIDVRERKDKEPLGTRGVNDNEIEERFVERAASAHPRLAIKIWGRCSDCHQW